MPVVKARDCVLGGVGLGLVPQIYPKLELGSRLAGIQACQGDT